MGKLAFKDYKAGDKVPESGLIMILVEAYCPDPKKPQERILRLWYDEES
jgi:hypothetical protein